MKKYLLFLTIFSFCTGAKRPNKNSRYVISMLRQLAQSSLFKFEKRNLINWKQHLRELEKQKKWDEAIAFMNEVIERNPDDKDAHICMNYLLMNLLGEEDYDDSKEANYMKLAKWYFDGSYAKFSEDPEFLYVTGKTAVMGPWFFGIDDEDYEAMIDKASKLEPDNLVYNELYFWDLCEKNPKDSKLIEYAKLVLSENSPIERQLKPKGAAGEYLLEIKRGWAEDILHNAMEIES